MEEQRDVLALEFHGDGARRAQPVELDRAGPLGDAGGQGLVWHDASSIGGSIVRVNRGS